MPIMVPLPHDPYGALSRLFCPWCCDSPDQLQAAPVRATQTTAGKTAGESAARGAAGSGGGTAETALAFSSRETVRTVALQSPQQFPRHSDQHPEFPQQFLRGWSGDCNPCATLKGLETATSTQVLDRLFGTHLGGTSTAHGLVKSLPEF